MSKRKHNTLKLQQKIDIIKRVDAGESTRSLALEYGIGKSTVSDIHKNKVKILEYVGSSDSGPGARKTLKVSVNPEMEKAVYTWFLQERARGRCYY